MAQAAQDFDAGFEEPAKGGKFKLNQPGDWIGGEFVGSKPFVGEYGPTTIWFIKAVTGSFHANDIGMDKEPKAGGEEFTLTPGEQYGVFDHYTFHDEISKAQVGQKVSIRFLERKPSSQRKGKFYKSIQCKLDPNFKPTEEIPFM